MRLYLICICFNKTLATVHLNITKIEISPQQNMKAKICKISCITVELFRFSEEKCSCFIYTLIKCPFWAKLHFLFLFMLISFRHRQRDAEKTSFWTSFCPLCLFWNGIQNGCRRSLTLQGIQYRRYISQILICMFLEHGSFFCTWSKCIYAMACFTTEQNSD